MAKVDRRDAWNSVGQTEARRDAGDGRGNLGAGMTPGEILEEHPILTPEMIQACLMWAADPLSEDGSRRTIG